MAAIGPLKMAQDNVLRVQTLLAADLEDIGELWDFQIACIREMSLINGGHITLSGNVTLRTETTMLGILEGKICTAVCAYERGERGFGIGWDRRLWALLRAVAQCRSWSPIISWVPISGRNRVVDT